ncbi:hypothetical protein [Bifidobacterium sp. ESL0745]|uniref:hypothetical protein n=1 Tax=Bifidobacterium sp. ESL0745 TaxID=2983226 RepID=UPI0023F7B236|nr:hypothetical protein [Bifidobacterium sp. ESL0745]MDF7665705.1 hypothetical protein [Bifidobacterium sp. ESL0745]
MTRSEPSRKVCDTVDMRDGRCCLRCGRAITEYWPGASRHHRRPRRPSFGRVHQPENLMLVDGSGDTGCHGYIHAHPAESYRKGWIVHRTVNDPSTVPVLTAQWGWVWLLPDGMMRRLTDDEVERRLLETGLCWSKEELETKVGLDATVTDSDGDEHQGVLTAVTTDSDGVVAVTLGLSYDCRLEDFARIDFENQRKEKQ